MACSTLRSSAPGSQSSARSSPIPGYPELGLSFGAFMRVLYWRTFTARPDGARARRLLSLLRRLAVFAAARPAARAARAPLLPPAGLPSFSSPTLPPFLDWDFCFRDTSVGTNGFPSHAWVIFPLR